jgi:hypothetical protein
LDEILGVNLTDDSQAWELKADGSWMSVEGSMGIATHRALRDLANDRARAES